MRFSFSLLVASFAVAASLPAAAAPKVLLCIDDGGDGSGATTQQSLQATKAFATVDLMDCSQVTPTPQQLLMYDAVFTSDEFQGFADANTLGDNLAGYVDLGGGVVNAMGDFDAVDGINLGGKWSAGGYDCVLPNGQNGINFNLITLTKAPNEAMSPLVTGVTGVTSTESGDGTINQPMGAVSVWDFNDGTPGVCRMTLNGHQRVDLNFAFTQGATIDAKPGDAITLLKNALLFVSGGFNPLQGMPNPVMFPTTGTFAVSAPQTITYTNTGKVGVTVTGLTVSGNPPDYLIMQAPAFPLAVAAGGNFTTTVAFSPQVAGVRAGTLAAQVMGQMFDAEVQLTGTAVPSELAVTPNPLALGGTQINVPVTKVVTITNKGMAKVTVTQIAITAGGPAFTVSGLPGLPIQLAANGSFTVNVVFNPAMDGPAAGALTISSNDPNTPMIVVPLTACSGAAGISVDVGSLAYGNVNLGASQPDVINVTNSGCANLTVTDIQLGGANPGDFVLNKMNVLPNMPISAGASEGFTVSFKPTVIGNRSATVTVLSAAGNKVINLLGTGTTAMLKLNTMAVAFGSVPVGGMSMPSPVIATNMGTGTLQIMAVSFAGPNATSFTSDAMAPTTIGPNANLTINVTCTPMAIGALTGTMTIATDVGNGVVNLTCTGVAPMISLAPNMLNFGTVVEMDTSMPMAITITNTGTADLHIMDVEVAGANLDDFNVTDEPMQNMAIPAKGTLVIHVTFTPALDAMETAEVDITSDDPNPMNMTAVVQLIGTGAQASIGVNPMTIDFGSLMTDTTKKVPLTISNTGDLPITVSSISVGGAFGVDDMASKMLKPGDSYMVNVSFTPQTVGMLTGTLTITPAAPLDPISVALMGIGVGPMLSVSPPSIAFGPIGVGTSSTAQTVTLRNGGTSALSLMTIASSDPSFTVDTTGTTLMLAAMASTTFNVTYTPKMAGNSNAQITVTLVGGAMPAVSMSVSGSGAVPKLAPTSGCSCDVGGAHREAPLGPLLAVIGLGALLLRRRRRVAS